MKPGLLVILDGFAWGDPNHPCNAVALADTPLLDDLHANAPQTEVFNHEHHVGLPEGQMGNSEVGHMCIGAGRVLYQDFLRINHAVEEGTFAEHHATAYEHLAKTGGRLHILSLLGDGGVHAHERHMGPALEAARAAGISDVYVHAIGDGRDTLPRSAEGFFATLQAQIRQAGVGKVATMVGRFYAMDRDKRWERTQLAYDLYRNGVATREAGSHEVGLAAAYEADEDDEFWKPTLLDAEGTIRDGDAVVFLNFRPDRARQITRAFMQPNFDGFEREQPQNVHWVCTTQYDAEFLEYPNVQIAYPPHRPTQTLGELISQAGLRQLRVAETEKYAHVTFFLNGGQEEPFEGEERVLIPSPKVATYDMEPAMGAYEITDAILAAMDGDAPDLVVVNYANGDMVGHTGNLKAGIEAVEHLDHCLSKLLAKAEEKGYVSIITSDHGNCEEMCESHHGEVGQRLTNHSLLPSPFVVLGAGDVELREGGSLANVAPTLLRLMGLEPSSEMEADLLL